MNLECLLHMYCKSDFSNLFGIIRMYLDGRWKKRLACEKNKSGENAFK
jgi:hypothetical protein